MQAAVTLAEWQRWRRNFSFLCSVSAGIFGVGYVAATSYQADAVPLSNLAGTPWPTISSTLLWLTLAIGIAVTGVSYRRLARLDPRASEAEREAAKNGNEWLSRWIIAAIVGLVLFMAGNFVVASIDLSAAQARVEQPILALIAGLYSFGLGFILSFWAQGLRMSRVLWVVAGFVVVGVLVAAQAFGFARLLQESVSALGTEGAGGAIFNFTVILAGLGALAISVEEIDLLRILRNAGKLAPRSFRILQVSLILLCVFCIAVGLFPIGSSRLVDNLHTIAGVGAGLTALFLMLAIGRLAPGYPRTFLQISAVLAVLSIGCVIAFVFFQFPFSLMEICIGVIFGVWVVLFKRYNEIYAAINLTQP